MDVHVPRSVTVALRTHGADIVTALEDDAAEFGDDELLDRATVLQRVLVTQDQDFLRIGAFRMADGHQFWGIVFAPQSLAIALLIRDLELVALIGEPYEFANRIEYLPL